MPTSGVSLILDLYDCKSPALAQDDLLEQLFVNALQFAGLEVIDHLAHRLPNQGTTCVYILKQSHATLHVTPASGWVSVDVYAGGKPEVVRPALEIIRGYLTQKLIARSVQAQMVVRGGES